MGFAVAVEAFAGEFSAIDGPVAVDTDGVDIAMLPHWALRPGGSERKSPDARWQVRAFIPLKTVHLGGKHTPRLGAWVESLDSAPLRFFRGGRLVEHLMCLRAG